MRRRAIQRSVPEDSIQADIVENAFKTGLREDVRYFAVPNGGYRDWRTARTMKDTGTIAGIPDLVLVDSDGRTHFIEVKTRRGSLSDEQSDFGAWCLEHGIPWAVVRSRAETIEVLRGWRLLKAEYL